MVSGASLPRAAVGLGHRRSQAWALSTSLSCPSQIEAAPRLTPDRMRETQLQADVLVGPALLHSWALSPQPVPRQGAWQACSGGCTEEGGQGRCQGACQEMLATLGAAVLRWASKVAAGIAGGDDFRTKVKGIQ